MDLMEHDLVIVESKEDAAVVVKAAQKLGYETSADHRSSEQNQWNLLGDHDNATSRHAG